MPIDIPDELRRLRTEAAQLAQSRERLVAGSGQRISRKDLLDIDRDLGAVLDRFRVDPCDASPRVPLVLLPVRVQTKSRGSTLLVRITPDEIHVDQLSRSLTEAEIEAGHSYWSTVWPDSEEPGDGALGSAWEGLVTQVGADRAGWVARAMTPTNLDQRGAADPTFPEAPAEVAAGDVARCLPDRFVVSVHIAGRDPIVVTGSPVPRDLPLSPLAFDDDEVSEVQGLRVPLGSEWTVDFAAATKVGLGIEVKLPRGVSVIDSVVVVGVRGSASESDNARDLTELFVSHAYGDGFGTVPHGTATNNADAERSPYQPDATMGPPALVPAATSAESEDIARLLGVDGATLESLLPTTGARSTLSTTQEAANTALWWVTWEPVLRKVDDAEVPGVTPSSIESARRLHRDDVRGAGHTSAIRVGAQPYGILPVSDLSRWRPRSGETTAAVVPLIQRVLERWVRRAARLPRVRPGDDVSDAALLDMLGTSPVSIGVRARPAADGPQVSTLAKATGAADGLGASELKLAKAVLSQYSPELARRVLGPALGEPRLLPLPLVSPRDPEVIAEILADRSPKVDSILQALLDLAWDEAKEAVFRAAPEAHVSTLIDTFRPAEHVISLVTAATSPIPIDQAIAAAPARSADEFFSAAATVRATVHFDGQPTEAVSLAAFEPVAESRTSLANVAIDLGDTPEARWVGDLAIAGILERFGMRWQARDAMTALGAAPIEERRIAAATALDLASHRVDAWATGVAAARQRTLDQGEGISLGAFGYVENIRLGQGAREPEGWLHAPSTSHAVAAGILTSAHRSRIGAKDGAQPFAIDLSSRRGAELRRVLEGMQRGQSIGALLGYQIERALTGEAARFQLSLRQIAPMNTDLHENELASEERTARLAAASVVDGVGLLKQFPIAGLEGGSPALRTRLGVAPKNAYIPDGGWPPVNPQEWETIKAALKAAAETLDVVSDALLSESVLHYVSGNAARASAAMDAMGSGAAVDPDLAVLGVRQHGRVLTHMAYALIPDSATGWSTSRPRAAAEPRLEAWAARRLGDPANLVVGEGSSGLLTLADAGLAALDLVFADDVADLVQELQAALPDLTSIASSRESDWPATAWPLMDAVTLARSLRAIAAGATPLTPDRVIAQGNERQHDLDLDELLARTGALVAALREAVEAAEPVIAAIDPLQRAVDEADAPGVQAAVQPLAAYGVGLRPNAQEPADVGWALAAWETAAARLDLAGTLLDDLLAPREPDDVLTDSQVLDRARAVVEAVLGDGFPLLPVLRRIDDAGDDLGQALTAPLFAPPATARISAFVRAHATVHAGMAKLAESQLIGRAIGLPVPLVVAQLTHRGEDGTPDPGTDLWLAGDLPEDHPWPAQPVTHVVVELVDGPVSDNLSGILFDNWVESLPYRPDARALAPDAVDTPLRHARATTGLAIHAHQASARAPQVILSAVSPDGQRWTTASVVAAVRSAVALSQARLVTYEKLPGDAAILPAAYVASRWLQPRKGLWFADLAKIPWASVAYPFVSEVK